MAFGVAISCMPGPSPAMGLGLADLLGLQAQGATDAAKKDVNCIFLFLVGGPSQLDTWDMKPDAPVGNPRPLQAHQDQRSRHRDLRKLPAHGQACG